MVVYHNLLRKKYILNVRKLGWSRIVFTLTGSLWVKLNISFNFIISARDWISVLICYMTQISPIDTQSDICMYIYSPLSLSTGCVKTKGNSIRVRFDLCMYKSYLWFSLRRISLETRLKSTNIITFLLFKNNNFKIKTKRKKIRWIIS